MRLRRDFLDMPLRLWLAMGVLLPAAAAAILVFWQAREVDPVIRDMELRLLAHDAQQLAERLRAELRPSEEDLDFVRALIEARVLDRGVSDEVERFLVERVRSRPGISGAFLFDSTTGDFVLIDRDGDDGRMQSLRPAAAGDIMDRRTFGEDTRPVALDQRPLEEYAPRSRPWYALAMTRREIAWTEPYILYPSGLPGITVVAPMLGPAGEVASIIGVTLNLHDLASTVAALPSGEWSDAAVLSFDGEFLGDSAARLHGSDMAATARHLQRLLAEDGGGLADRRGAFEFATPRGTIVGAIAPLTRSDDSWLVLVQAPALTTLQLIVENQRIGVIATALVFVALAIAWSWLAWHWLARPLAAACAFAAAQPSGQVPGTFMAGPFREVRRLRADLQAMSREIGERSRQANRLQASLQDANARLESLLKAAPLAVVELQGEGAAFRIARWSGRSAELFGRTSGDVEGRLLDEATLVPAGDLKSLDGLVHACASTGPVEAEIPFLTAAGEVRIGRWHGSPVEPSGAGPAVLLIVQDDTERKASFEAIDRLANRDPLTGLPNRRAFLDHVEQAMRQAERRGERLALWVLDIDDFKGINDGYGHADGDAVLCQLAARMSSLIRKSDLAARLGGDEFVILQVGLDSAEGVGTFQSRLRAILADPYDVNGRQLAVSVSVGMALYPTDAKEPGHLLRCADLALLAAKRDGRAKFAGFRPELAASLAGRRAREDRLRAAIAGEHLHLAFQPIWEVGTSIRPVGAEALLRWEDDGSAVPPAVFVALAEATGLIEPLGELALRLACRQVRRWEREGFALPIAINLSAAQLRRADLVERFVAILEEHDVAPARIEVEVTESLFLETTHAHLQLAQLRQIGFSVAIDDFGTGYANLASLAHMRPARLKIDRSFVQGLGTDRRSASIVRAMVTLARNLGITAVAEGVETRTQFEALRRMRCSTMQGFLLGKPGSPAELRRTCENTPPTL